MKKYMIRCEHLHNGRRKYAIVRVTGSISRLIQSLAAQNWIVQIYYEVD